MGDLKWNKHFAFEQCGEDRELLEELLALLTDSSTSDLLKIKEGIAAGNPTAVADAAHSITGAAASLGFDGLQQVAFEFEKSGRAGAIEGLKVAVLEDLVQQLKNLKI
jgi:HPt (histidine-containing phosphotransfer) domain-containing protein